MKVTIVIHQMWNGGFSAMMALVFLSILQVNGMNGADGTTISVRKIFEQELEVPAGTTIRTQGPGMPSFEMHGTMSSTSEAGAYTLKGKGGELVMKIDRKFNIFTWDKNIVKHKVVVNIEADNAAMEKEVLDALTMNLQLSPDNAVEIDCFLGIQKITMRNGWFKGNDNTLIMRSGKRIKFRSLTISSILRIPKDSNLDIKTKYMDITLGTLNGVANLDLTGATFTAKYIQDLQAKLRNSNLNVTKVEKASVSAQNSKVMLLDAGQIQIGNILLDHLGMQSDILSAYHPSRPFYSADHLGKQKGKYSSTNKYIFKDLSKLEVYSSLNDKFTIDEVEELKLMDVVFSEFDVSKLIKKAYGQFDFGELNIYGLHKTQFENVILTASFGSVHILSREVDGIKTVVKNISKPRDPALMEGPGFTMADNLRIGGDFKMISVDSQSEFIYQKGSYEENENRKGLIHLTCDYCDLRLN